MKHQEKKYIKNEKFLPDVVGKVSKAAKSLCMWVRAMDTYARVAKTVEPKKASLKAATDKLKESQATLKEKQDSLNAVEQRVLGLKRKLDDTQAKAKELEDQERDTQVKLERAGKLVGGLGSEKTRWEQLCKDLNDSQKNLVGNMLDEWTRTGYLWEQYDPDTGSGMRTHPFNGWSSLALLALAEIY